VIVLHNGDKVCLFLCYTQIAMAAGTTITASTKSIPAKVQAEKYTLAASQGKTAGSSTKPSTIPALHKLKSAHGLAFYHVTRRDREAPAVNHSTLCY